MNFLSQLSLKKKVKNYLLVLLPPIVIALMIFVNAKNLVIPTIKEKFNDTHKVLLNELVVAINAVLSNYNQLVLNEELTVEKAQELALKTLSNIKFGESEKNYIWIINLQGEFLSHPYFSDSIPQCKKQRSIYDQFRQESEIKKEGFYKYTWPYKSDTTSFQPKIAYYQLFEPWGWMVGAGFYTNDITTEIESKIKEIITIVAFSGAVLFIVLVIITIINFKGVKVNEKQNQTIYSKDTLLNNLIKNSGEGLIIYENNKLVLANNNFLNILNLLNVHFISLRLIYLVDRKCRKSVWGAFHDAVRSENYYDEKSFWVTLGNGEQKYLKVKFVSQTNLLGDKLTFFLVSDITNTKRDEDRIEELLNIVKQSPNSIVITDLKGCIEYVNSAFENKTGYQLDEIYGENPRIIKSNQMPKGVYENLWESISSGNIWSDELLNKDKDGNLFWELTVIYPIRNSNGEMVKYVAVKTDVTELKNIKYELIAAKNKAEESERIKTSFLRNVNHEVNTPLNGIFGFTQVLLSENAINGKHKEYLMHIYRSTKVLHRIFKDIMHVSVDDIDPYTDVENKFYLNETIYKLCSKYNLQIHKNNKTELTLHFLPDRKFNDVVLLTNKRLFSMALDKLAENAIKYTHSGLITIRYNITKKEILFSIQDTGVGIPDDEQSMIFDMFYHGQTDFVSQHRGLGMGLNIAQKCISKMNGSIEFKSVREKGTTFYFKLPIELVHFNS